MRQAGSWTISLERVAPKVAPLLEDADADLLAIHDFRPSTARSYA